MKEPDHDVIVDRVLDGNQAVGNRLLLLDPASGDGLPGRLPMKPYVSNANPHVMQNRIGETGRHGETQQGMHQSQRKDVAVTPKHLAENNPPTKLATVSTGLGMCTEPKSPAVASTAQLLPRSYSSRC